MCAYNRRWKPLFKLTAAIVVAVFALNTAAAAETISYNFAKEEALAAPTGLAQPEFREKFQIAAFLLSHEAVNKYIAGQIEKENGILGGSWEERNTRKINLKELLVPVPGEEGAGAVTSVTVVSVTGLLKHTGQFAHVGLRGEHYGGTAVIYIDSRFFNDPDQAIEKHEIDEIVQWEGLRAGLLRLANKEEMRQWIKEHIDSTDERLNGTELEGKTARQIARILHNRSYRIDYLYGRYLERADFDYDYIATALALYGPDSTSKDVNIAAARDGRNQPQENALPPAQLLQRAFFAEGTVRGEALLLEDDPGEREITNGIFSRMGLKVFCPKRFKPNKFLRDGKPDLPEFIITIPEYIDRIKELNPAASVLAIVNGDEKKDFSGEGVVTISRREIRGAYKLGRLALGVVYGFTGHGYIPGAQRFPPYTYDQKIVVRPLLGTAGDKFVPYAFHPPPERFKPSEIIDESTADSLYGWGQVFHAIDLSEKGGMIINAIVNYPLDDIEVITERQRIFEVLSSDTGKRAELKEKIRPIIADSRKDDFSIFDAGEGSYREFKRDHLLEPVEENKWGVYFSRERKNEVEDRKEAIQEAIKEIKQLLPLLKEIHDILDPAGSIYLNQLKNNLRLVFDEKDPGALPHLIPLLERALNIETDNLHRFNDEVRPVHEEYEERRIGASVQCVEDALKYLLLFIRFSEYFEKDGWVKPGLLPPEANLMDIQDGRDPMVEISRKRRGGWDDREEKKSNLILPESVVTNSFRFDEQNNVMIVRGPNMDGKTIAIQTALRIAMLMQTGMYVPASSARAGMYNRIIHRAPRSGSIEHGLSSFGFDVDTIKTVNSKKGRGVLIGIDELGRHTNASDGSSLAYASLRKAGLSGAHVIAATHFPDLEELGELPGFSNWHMDYAVNPDGSVELKCKLVPGPGESKALVVARAMGLQEELAETAEARLLERMAKLNGTEVQMRDSPANTLKPLAKARAISVSPRDLGSADDAFSAKRFGIHSDILDDETISTLDGWNLIISDISDHKEIQNIVNAMLRNPTTDLSVVNIRLAMFSILTGDSETRNRIDEVLGELVYAAAQEELPPGVKIQESDKQRLFAWLGFLGNDNAASALNELMSKCVDSALRIQRHTSDNQGNAVSLTDEQAIARTQVFMQDAVEMFGIIHGKVKALEEALDQGESLFLKQIRNSLKVITDPEDPGRLAQFFERLEALAAGEFTSLKDFEQAVSDIRKDFEDVINKTNPCLAPEIQSLKESLYHLKAFVDLAGYFAKHSWNKPVVKAAEEEVFDVCNGWHPALGVVRKSYYGRSQGGPPKIVKNSMHLDAINRLLLLTGSNMDGKSCGLQMALFIQIFAQAGLFAPAESAEVSLVERIIHRTPGRGSLEHSISSFGEDVRAAEYIADKATPYSFIGLDEPGRSTNPLEGDAVAWAVTKKIIESGARGVVITHFEGLNELEKFPGVAAGHVEVKAGEGGNPVLTYKILPGHDTSDGIAIARLMGLPGSIETAARARREELKTRFKDSGSDDSGEKRPPAPEVRHGIDRALHLMNELIPAQLKSGRAYEIRYDSARLREYQRQSGVGEEFSPETLLKMYVQCLQMRAPCENPQEAQEMVKLIESSARDGAEQSLISVSCYGDKSKTRLIGESRVNIKGDLEGRALPVIEMLNLALLSSNIPDDLFSQNDLGGYIPILSLIREQYEEITGKELTSRDMLQAIRFIELAPAKPLPVETIREYYRLAITQLRQAA